MNRVRAEEYSLFWPELLEHTTTSKLETDVNMQNIQGWDLKCYLYWEV